MVNTFIPYPDFKKCAKVLDNKRLGKQRVEAKQILNILTGETQTKGWRNHVVTKMWRDYESALKLYYNIIVEEWISRGFKNTMKLYDIKEPITMPWFVNNKSINTSHQANLIRKYDLYYRPIFPDVPEIYVKYRYIWPSKLNEQQTAELKNNSNKILDITKYAEIMD